MTEPTSRRAKWSAHEILRDYGIQDPRQIDLDAICVDKGVLVIDAPLKGAIARLIRNRKDRALVRVSDKIAETGQRRFAIAHELGHFILHAEKNQLSLCVQKELLFWYQSLPPEEYEANIFAVELLMPDFMFEPRSAGKNPAFATIRELSTEFNTSLTATTLRYLDFAHCDCAMIFSENGRVKWFKTSKDFPCRLLENGTKLNADSVAGRLFAERPNVDGPKQVPLETWVEDPISSHSFTIQEDTVHLRTYNAAISLISIEPGSPLDRFLFMRGLSNM